jgi:hypothetical protein
VCVCVCVCVCRWQLLIGFPQPATWQQYWRYCSRCTCVWHSWALVQPSCLSFHLCCFCCIRCQKRPITVSKEAYYSVKRDLLQCQRRPITVSKETYYSVKRDLIQCQRYLFVASVDAPSCCIRIYTRLFVKLSRTQRY